MTVRTGTLRAAWERVADRYAGYRLTLPGEPGFICQPHSCDASCCRNFNVALDGREVERLRGASGWPPARFLESEDGQPLALPLATPFVLARREGHCVFLDADLTCGQYAARPNACRSYPHQVIFVDAEGGWAAQPSPEAGRRAVEAVIAGRTADGPMPLLLRHGECPGFTGPPVSAREWARLLRATYALATEDGAGEVVR